MLITGFASGPLQANCYVLAAGPDSPCLVIDPGQQATAPLQQILAKHHLRPAAVLLTHGHFDHVFSAAAVSARYDIDVYLSDGDRQMLLDPLAALSPDLRQGMTSLLGPGEHLQGLLPDRLQPLGSIAETLNMAGLRCDVIPVPGHTPGSTSYHFPQLDEAGVVCTGDTLFAGSIGRTDLPGGSHEQILSSIRDRLLTLEADTVVLPGHGPATTIGDEAQDNPFLQ